MIGFHIDMNMAQYTAPYLKGWLAKLAAAGYDTILWEIENNVRFDTCPECASPDAFTKDEFREILAECRRLGLEPIPLFQTIGHAEYVLKHERYAHLKELPDKLDQYCPSNPEVVPFLHRWIEEYLDLFGPVKYFHIGADEAWWLGACPRCKAFAAQFSLSQLYVDHVNQVAAPLIEQGITPILWADMLLHYPEAQSKLSRKFTLFDWIYSVYRGSGKVHVWGEGLVRGEELRRETLLRFGSFLFPDGDEPGREPETFYTADYLASLGFDVVTCPSASSYGDNVFSPRNWLHTANTYYSFDKGRKPHLRGSVLTSWSVHLFPWELQWGAIGVPAYLAQHADVTHPNYRGWLVQEHFGAADLGFWRAAGMLAKSCLFTHTASLGFSKDCRPVHEDHAAQVLYHLMERQALKVEADDCRQRLADYQEGLRLFEAFEQKAAKNLEELAIWKLAARSLAARARASLFLLENAVTVIAGRELENPSARETARSLLAEQRALKAEARAVYEPMIRPTRREEMLDFMYAAVEQALASLIRSG